MSDIYMRIAMGVVGSSTVVNTIQSVAKAFGQDGLVGALGAVSLAATGAAVALGVAAVQAAGNFQQGLTSLVTGAGEAQSNLGQVSDGMLKLAVDTGTTTTQLTSGMYQIESAGYHGADGLAVLKAAAEGAKVGNADLAVVANGVTTVMTDYASQNITASQATNTLIATVASGKTNLQDLSSALASVLPTASSAQVGLTDVMAAMSTMTGEGVPAADAATYLRQTLMTLSAPSKSVTDALASIGLTSQQVSDGMKQSLPNTLQMIMDALGKKFPVGSVEYQTALTQIAGGTKQMQGILDLTGTHMSTFTQNFGHISQAATSTSSTITGWNLVQQNFSQKMDQAREVVEVLGVKIGTALLPVATSLLNNVLPLISSFSNWITNSGILQTSLDVLKTTIHDISGFVVNLSGGISNLVGWFQKHHAAATALLIPLGMLSAMLVNMAIGAVVSFVAAIPALVAGFGAWAVSAGAAAIAQLALIWPILLIGAAIGLVIAVIILVVTHWNIVVALWQATLKVIGQWFSALGTGVQVTLALIGGWFSALGTSVHAIFSSIGEHIGGFFSTLGTIAQATLQIVVGFFQNTWGNITGIFIGAATWFHDNVWQPVVDRFTTVFNGLKDKAQGIWSSITDGVKAAFNSVITLINNGISGINNVSSKVGIPAIPSLPYLASGGLVTSGGLAVVGEHGAEVVSLPQNAAVYPHGSVPAGSGGVTNIFYINLSTMARSQSEVRNLVDMMEAEIGRRVRVQTSGYASGGVW